MNTLKEVIIRYVCLSSGECVLECPNVQWEVYINSREGVCIPSPLLKKNEKYLERSCKNDLCCVSRLAILSLKLCRGYSEREGGGQTTRGVQCTPSPAQGNKYTEDKTKNKGKGKIRALSLLVGCFVRVTSPPSCLSRCVQRVLVCPAR